MDSHRVAPDPPVMRIDPTNLDAYDLSDEEKEAVLALWTKQQLAEEKARRDEALAYQTEQAQAVLSWPGWSEICADWLDNELSSIDRLVFGDPDLNQTDVYGFNEDEGRWTRLPTEIPTIHQFYRDLYGDQWSSDLCDMDPVPVLVNHRDRKHPYQVYTDYPSFINGVKRETSFIYLGRFWEPTRSDGVKFPISKKNAMTHISGVCVDVDRVEDDKGQYFQASWVMESLYEFLDSHKELMPNYLMLSGTGIQLWYVFGEPIPLLSKSAPRRARYDAFIKRLYAYLAEHLPRNRFKVDTACAAYNHAFRAPGSPSKAGYPARLFVKGGKNRVAADPIAISDYIGGGLKPYDVGEWDPDRFSSIKGEGRGASAPATEKQLAYIAKLHDMGCIEDETFDDAGNMSIADADAAIKLGENAFVRGIHWRETQGGYVMTSHGHKVRLKSRNRGLYDNTLERIYNETKPGSRYMSMFVLAGFAYNCNVSKSELRHDLETLMNSEWGRKPSPSDRKPINSGDINSAMRGYNPIGCLRPKAISEELLGWSFGETAKRNGRTRKEHLQGSVWFEERDDGTVRRVPNKARTNREEALRLMREDVADEKQKILAEYLSSHPKASKRQAAKELHMSPPTVQKYWPEACKSAGIEDVRTGNHSPK